MESLGYCFMFTVHENAVPWKNEVEFESIAKMMKEFIKLDYRKVDPKFQQIHKFIKMS